MNIELSHIVQITRKKDKDYRQHCVALMAGKARFEKFVSRINHLMA